MQVLVLDLHISTFTRILQNVNRSALPESTVLHLPAPLLVDSQDVYTLLSPSAHSQCAVAFSHNGKAKVSGLPKYVASTTRSRTQQVYNGTVLNRHRQGTTSSLKLDASQDSARSWFIIIMVFSRSRNEAEKNRCKNLFPTNDETIAWFLSKTMHY